MAIPAYASGEDIKLCLELRLVDHGQEKRTEVEVDVELRNCGSQYVVIPPRLLPQSTGDDPEPWAILSFVIRSQDGSTVPYTGEWIGNKLKLPAPEEYIVLGPGYFFGARISLSEGFFEYDLTWPGEYIVVAEVGTSAREWILGHSDRKARYDASHVFSGSVRSRPITIVLRGEVPGEY